MEFESKFSSLVKLIRVKGLAGSLLQDVFAWGGVYGELLSANYFGVYRDDSFEELLVSRYIKEKTTSFSVPVDASGELHIVSEPFATGGHTRLLERLVSMRGGGDVLVTRPLSCIDNRLRLSADNEVFFKVDGFEVDEIVDIVKMYKTIFLHVHPEDLSACVAVGVIKKLGEIKVILVNHADHVFSFGFYCADLVAEVSGYGFYLSQVRRQVKSSFLGIPLEMKNLSEIFERDIQSAGEVNIFTAGQALKYKPSKEFSFPVVASKILSEIPQARITVVGPNLWSDWWWWCVKFKNIKKINIVKALPYDRYVELLDGADVYVDSFPMTGGTVLPEIRSRGIPVTGILSGSIGYTPFDATKFDTSETLVSELKRFFSGRGGIMTSNNSAEIIDLAQSVHGMLAVSQRLDHIVSSNEGSAPPSGVKSYDIDFYGRQWRSEQVVSLSRHSILFLFNSAFWGDYKLLRALVRFLTVKQAFEFFLKILRVFGR
jgi:hypothetical protein